MDFNFINLSIITLLLFIINDYTVRKSNLSYSSVSLIIISVVLAFNWVFTTNLFISSEWKLVFLVLVLGIYFVVTELIEDKDFDIYCLVTLVFLGSIVLINCDNFITLYLGLELQTFSIFILIAKNRLSIKSSEAGLKYFILGALSSGFYLVAISVLFLTGNSLEIKEVLSLSLGLIENLCLGLIILSFCFKLSLVPLHFWIPDIYEGSSWDIITLIGTLPKISVLSILCQVLFNTNIALSLSIASIIVGTLGSLNQTKTKRLLGYSGISHMGYIVLGFSLLNSNGLAIGTLYMVLYMFTMLSIFIVILFCLSNSEYIIELSYLKFTNKLIAATLILLILSVAGIPPLSGFISKWFLLWTILDFNTSFGALIVILFSAIGAGYYLRLVKIIYFQKKSSFFLWKSVLTKREYNNETVLLFLGFLFFVNIFIIANFSFLVDLINLNFI